MDAPVLGYRDDILRRTFDPGEDAYANLPKRDAWHHGGELDEILDMRGVPLTWDTLDEIRSWAPLPLVLKGILTAEDARLAVDHGADAVWVSNHGGRQLDRSPAGIEVLEEVVDAVEGRADVYLDGGIRRGPDVLVALAPRRDAPSSPPGRSCTRSPAPARRAWRMPCGSTATRSTGPSRSPASPARAPCAGTTCGGPGRLADED